LPGIPLRINSGGGLNFHIGFDYKDLVFAYAQGSGFSFDTSQRDPLTLHAVASFARDANGQPTTLDANLGLFLAQVKDGSDQNSALRSQFDVTFKVDVDATNPNLVRPDGLDGQADVYLQATAAFNLNNQNQFPSFTSDFEMHWGFGTFNPQ